MRGMDKSRSLRPIQARNKDAYHMHLTNGRKNRIGRTLGLVTALAGIALTSAALAPAQAQTPQIILQCTAPLVANADGTDCVQPDLPAKGPANLTAFSIRAGDGQHIGLFIKTGPKSWVGPSLDGGPDTQWSETAADTGGLVLYTEIPRIRTLIVYAGGRVASSGLPGGSVLGDRQY